MKKTKPYLWVVEMKCWDGVWRPTASTGFTRWEIRVKLRTCRSQYLGSKFRLRIYARRGEK